MSLYGPDNAFGKDTHMYGGRHKNSMKRAAASHAKLGTGKRFAALKSQLASRPGVQNPGALAAYIGRRAHSAKQMAKWSAAGRRRG